MTTFETRYGSGQPEPTRNASGHPDRPYDDVDVSSWAFWSSTMAERDKNFAMLRADRPVSWHPPFEGSLLEDPEDYGFWAVVRHADLVEVTERHEDFLSGPGILAESLPPELVEAAQSIIGMDPPRHTQMRRLVASAFTPKQMRRIDGHIRANARRVVDHLAAAGGEADFVAECAALLPMHNINDILGVPEGLREQLQHESAIAVGFHDPELMGGHDREQTMLRLLQALNYSQSAVADLVEHRRRNPEDDLLTALVQAEIDGERLTDDEISAFFMLLTIAGNDTTRQSTSHALRALTEHPDQREWLLADLDNRIDGAVEEFVRWATPIIHFRRTAARDVELHGQHITAGDKVVLFYSSANRDEQVFSEPWRFDLTRDPNPHITFGGGGIHHCLGNQLARTQLRALYRELLSRLPDIEADEPEFVLPNNFLHAVKRMPCRFTPDR